MRNATDIQEIWIRALSNINFMKYSSTILLPLFFVTTILGNIFTIVGFLANRSQWSKHHVYLFVMSVSDIFSVTMSFLYDSAYSGMFVLTRGRHYFSLYATNIVFCKLGIYFMVVAQRISMSMPLVLAFDRIHALYHPFHYRLLTRKYFYIVSFSVIVLNFVLAVIGLPYYTSFDIPDFFGQGISYPLCFLDFAKTPIVAYLYLVTSQALYGKGAIPIILLFCTNIVVIRKVFNILKSSKNMTGSASNDEQTMNTKAARAGRISILISILYVVGFAPLAAIYVFSLFYVVFEKPAAQDGLLSFETYRVTRTYYTSLIWSLAFVNPLVYTINCIIYIKDVRFLNEQFTSMFTRKSKEMSSRSSGRPTQAASQQA